MQFLTPKQVRELVSLSRTTLWRLCRAGHFPQPVRISAGRVAFLHQEVEDWMKARLDGGRSRGSTDARSHDQDAAAGTQALRLRRTVVDTQPTPISRAHRRPR